MFGISRTAFAFIIFISPSETLTKREAANLKSIVGGEYMNIAEYDSILDQ